MERRMERVDLYNRLVRKYMGEMFPGRPPWGWPLLGSREQVREVQARALEDKEMLKFYQEEERDGEE